MNSKLAFDSNKNPGVDMGKIDSEIIHSEVKPEQWGESNFSDTLGKCVWIKPGKGKQTV